MLLYLPTGNGSSLLSKQPGMKRGSCTCCRGERARGRLAAESRGKASATGAVVRRPIAHRAAARRVMAERAVADSGKL